MKKWSYLLRDIPFKIKTDHRNLLFLNLDASQKVQRWKMEIQAYDFTIEHIQGKYNIIPDLYSRLCLMATKKPSQWTPEERKCYKASKPLRTPSYLFAVCSAQLTTPKPSHSRHKPTPLKVRRLIEKVHGWRARTEVGKDKKGRGISHSHGHGGVEKTLRLLRHNNRASQWWGTMRHDVKQFIKLCPGCQFMRQAKLQIHTQIDPFTMSKAEPMERWNIDTVGPFPPDVDGNNCVIVIVDVYSRWVEFHACKDFSAASAAKAIIQSIGRYGTPSEILTDNGKQFIADILLELYDCINTQHLRITPYSHQENTFVERQNRELMKHLRAIMFDRKMITTWSQALPLIQRVMNASVNKTTGFTPAQLFLGNQYDLDRNMLYDSRKSHPDLPISQRLIDLMNMQAEIIARVNITQDTVNAKRLEKKLGKPRTKIDYPPHSLVLWEYPESGMEKDSRPNKFSPHYRGPYRVIDTQGSRVQIQNLVTQEVKQVLITQLVPFEYDPSIVDPTEIALHANGEFLVEKILSLSGNRNNQRHYKKTDLIVKVKWAGYEEPSDEPYTNLRYTEKFHEYCRQHRHGYLIPKDA
jgi:hypothetical protein